MVCSVWSWSCVHYSSVCGFKYQSNALILHTRLTLIVSVSGGHFWYTITSTFASTAGSKILLGIIIHSMMLCHVNTLQFLHSNILYYILLKMVSAPIKVEKTRASLKTFDLQPQQYYRAHRVKRTLLPVKPYVNKAITVQTFYQDHSLAIAWHAHPHHAKKYPYYWKFLPLFIW